MLFLRTLISLAVAVTALPFEKRSDSVGGGVKLDFAVKPSTLNTRNATIVHTHNKREQTVGLTNKGVGYYVDVALGLQKTSISVQIDTGSSDLWVAGPSANAPQQYTFDPSQSSSSQNTGNSFVIQYQDHTGANGPLYTDTVHFGGITVNGEFGVASSVTNTDPVFGIGFVADESAIGGSYPNIPVSLVQQGIISSNFYTLYLDSPESKTGSIIFGGTDDSKYTGALTTLSVNSPGLFSVTLDSVGGQTANYNVVLDSGTTWTLLPYPTVAAIVSKINNVQYDSNSGVFYFPDADIPKENLEYTFGDTTISIPFSELVQEITDDNHNPLGYLELLILVGSQTPNDPRNPLILGDNFLRYAYVVYDLDKSTVQIAQSKFT